MATFRSVNARLGLAVLTLQTLLAPLTLAEVVTSSEPSTVEHVQATPGDRSVTLTWDAATDDEGVEGYLVYTGLKSVEKNGGSYTLGSSDVGDATSATLDHLTNGVTYYFAVKAYDADDNESLDYSKEVEATPEEAETGDFKAPTVNHVAASSSTLVEVTFSEPVILPTDAASAFSLEASDGTAVEVLDAYTSTEESSIVYIVTDTQIAGAMYTLTASSSITDVSGNPISSGTSDTGVFTGSSLDEPESVGGVDATSSDEFAVEDVDATDENTLVLYFTQAVKVANPSSFLVQEADDATQMVEILAVSIDSENAKAVSLVTGDMESGYDYILTMDENILNENGAALSVENTTVEFTAKTLDLKDVIAPEDVTGFLSKAINETTVALEWTGSIDSAGDLAKYLVYESTDGGVNYGEALTLAPNTTDYQISGLTPGETYTFKITAVDENGNESEGVLTTVTLPEAGPELLLFLPFALLGAAWFTRRRVSEGL